MISPPSIAIERIALPPIHPGEILAAELAEIGVSLSVLSRTLDVPLSRVAEIIAGKRNVTADTAQRLAAYFGTSAQLWINLQATYDRKAVQVRVRRT